MGAISSRSSLSRRDFSLSGPAALPGLRLLSFRGPFFEISISGIFVVVSCCKSGMVSEGRPPLFSNPALAFLTVVKETGVKTSVQRNFARGINVDPTWWLHVRPTCGQMSVPGNTHISNKIWVILWSNSLLFILFNIYQIVYVFLEDGLVGTTVLLPPHIACSLRDLVKFENWLGSVF